MGGLLSTSRGQVDDTSLQQAAYQVRSNSSQRSGGDGHFESVEQVTEAIEKIGLESCNLIVGVDFTRSNEWTGRTSFGGRCLHDISGPPNPYQQVFSIINRTLSRFDEDGEIPFFGFGDASTHDHGVFSFYPDHRPCNGISEGQLRYEEIVSELRLSGPTSFAPIIEMAADTVKRSRYYHVLLIIADGQVTGVNDSSDCLSFQKQKTVEAIVNASQLSLSIILVGVGDGPWNQMEQFVSTLPPRSFNNFEFVNFTDIMSMDAPEPRKETQFALAVLRAIHSQYKATTKLQLNIDADVTIARAPLPPPSRNATGANPPEAVLHHEVIYNIETGQSRGFGFVTMSTIEEADKAIEMFNRYDISGRLLNVNRAAPKGSRMERPPRQFAPAFRAYVGNLPWQVDDSRLMQLFSEHGEVVNATVVYDRETGRSRGFGFVSMASKEELDDAISALDGQELDGRPLRVNVAAERPQRGF